jgi:hypothetical protein
MSIQVQYEADPYSELRTKEERHRQRMMLYEWQLKGAQDWIDDIVVPPPPDINDPDYGTERGIFTFDLAEIQTLIELAERNEALLQVGTWPESVSPYWQREWPFTPTEYYARVQSQLSAIQSAAEFDWKLFQPVYGPDSEGIDRLAAYLLEHGKGVCWCKACQQEYRAVELEIYDWENGESEGSIYLCPKDHALLRTYGRSMGALEIFSREGRTRRERQPNPVEELPNEWTEEAKDEEYSTAARRQKRKWWQFWR